MIQAMDPITSNLRGEMARRGISGEEMAEQMCMSISTYYLRLRSPEKFTIGELRQAAKFLKLNLEDLLRRK